VYLLASLVSALGRYHPTLPVLVTDDLLSETRHLLHANEFAKQQRLLGHLFGFRDQGSGFRVRV